MIKIYYSKDEGWFTPSYHTNYRLWGTLKETYPKCHYTLVIDRFEDTTFPFKIKEDIHLFSDGVEVSIVNEDNTEVDFRVQGTHSRFCELSSSSSSSEEGYNFCRFLEYLHNFDSVQEAEEMLEIQDPIQYETKEDLLNAIDEVLTIFEEYNDNPKFKLEHEMEVWLKEALARLGYTMERPDEDCPDAQLTDIAKTLNSLGYLVTKAE